MGIQMSSGGHGHGSMSEPNIVPLIDVLLVLIIIFMVVTPMTPKGLNALVPQPPPPDQNPDVTPDDRTVVIRVECAVEARGVCPVTNVKINEEQHSWDTLGPRLDEIFKTRAEKVAFVQGDDNLEFQQVARAIDITKGLGIDKIGLITAKVAAGE
jgi:biopolymer transport protein ExbD